AQQNKPSDVPAAAQPGSAAVPGTPAAAATAVPGAPAAPAAPVSQIVTVTTDVVKVDIDSVGGVIKRLELLHYPDHFDKTKNQVLFNVN
ncbi:YidC/Oxa1 family insertase periplasmic-domain containing protein, partial [Campylobacter coli]